MQIVSLKELVGIHFLLLQLVSILKKVARVCFVNLFLLPVMKSFEKATLADSRSNLSYLLLR